MGKWAIDWKAIEQIEGLKNCFEQSKENIRKEIKQLSNTVLRHEEGLGIYGTQILEECTKLYEYTIQCEETLMNIQGRLKQEQELIERLLK